jgi:hypothetical protein
MKLRQYLNQKCAEAKYYEREEAIIMTSTAGRMDHLEEVSNVRLSMNNIIEARLAEIQHWYLVSGHVV